MVMSPSPAEPAGLLITSRKAQPSKKGQATQPGPISLILWDSRSRLSCGLRGRVAPGTEVSAPRDSASGCAGVAWPWHGWVGALMTGSGEGE